MPSYRSPSWTSIAGLLLAVAATVPRSAAAQAPLLDDAVTCGRVGEVGAPRRGRDLFRIDVDAAAFPDALCNDGTRAVFFVRPACPSTPELRNSWHVHLEGGGACTTPQSCANRWCSVGTNFGAGNMSSGPMPHRIRAGGVFSRSRRNSFHCWNHVLVHYCSSDNWRGEGTVATVTADDPQGLADGCTPGVDCTAIDYAIHFRGATILDAVRDQLRHDCNGAACPASAFSADMNGDGVLDFAMPDLDDADVVLLSGSSAGSSGVRFHADALGAALRATNVHCLAGAPCDEPCVLGSCGLFYRAVVDAGLLAPAEGEDFTVSCEGTGFCGDCTTSGTCGYQDYLEGVAAASIHALTSMRAEDSCVAWHQQHDPADAGETWRCEDPSHLVPHHLTTPFFVRTDRQDPLLMQNFVEAGFGTCQEFGDAVEAVNRSLFDAACSLDCLAEEGGAVPPLALPGVFVPEHREHVALTSDRGFLRSRVEAPLGSGSLVSFHGVLFDWLYQTNAGLQQVVTEGSPVPPPYPAWCP